MVGSYVAAYKLSDVAPFKSIGKGVAPFGSDGDTGWAGTGGPNSLPWECALVVTTNAFVDPFTLNKARQRGRMYLGPLSALRVSGGGGLLAQADIDTLVGNLTGYFNDLNNAPTGSANQLRAVVMSRGGKSGLSAAAVSPIINVAIDNKVDSQRRRENKQGVNVVRTQGNAIGQNAGSW
jgi:hypothetical protein